MVLLLEALYLTHWCFSAHSSVCPDLSGWLLNTTSNLWHNFRECTRYQWETSYWFQLKLRKMKGKQSPWYLVNPPLNSKLGGSPWIQDQSTDWMNGAGTSSLGQIGPGIPLPTPLPGMPDPMALTPASPGWVRCAAWVTGWPEQGLDLACGGLMEPPQSWHSESSVYSG